MNSNEVKHKSSLFDPSWEKQQKRAFTEWCNSHLNKVNEKIECFDTDFMDGHALIKLLEVVSGENLQKPEDKTMILHKITNVNIAINFIKECGVKLISIGAEDIVNGNVKMTLGLIWCIILRFSIQNIQFDEMSSKDGLLLWCQQKINGYSGVDIQNFNSSFMDGMAFGALIHSHRPDLIDFSKYDINHPQYNLNETFLIAEKFLDIPRMFDVEDFLFGDFDEISIITYVSMFYHRFTSEQKLNKASETISMALKTSKETEQIIQDYIDLSSTLLEWIQRSIIYLNYKPEENCIDKAYEMLNNYVSFLHEKPFYYNKKVQLENTHHNLQTRFKFSGKSCFSQKQVKLVHDIQREWSKLDIADKCFEDWIFKYIDMLEFFAQLQHKFNKRCLACEGWLKESISELRKLDSQQLSFENIKSIINVVMIMKDGLFSNNSECDPLADISQMAEFFKDHQYYDMESINCREQTLITLREFVYNTCLNIITQLERLYSILEEADVLLLDYARRVMEFKKWLDSVIEELEDAPIVNNEDQVNDMLHSHREFEDSLPTAKSRLDEIQTLVLKIRSFSDGTNLPKLQETVFSTITFESILSDWDKMNNLRVVRLQTLENEGAHHRKIKAVTDDLRNYSIKVNDWITMMTEILNKVNDINSTSLEPELEYLRECESELGQFKCRIDKLQDNYEKLLDLKVIDIRNMGYSVDKLVIDYKNLCSFVSSQCKEYEEQMLYRQKCTKASSDIINIYKTCFEYFDNDCDHKLSYADFKNCLISVGYDVNDDFNDLIKQLDKDNSGYVTFSTYMEFMEETSYKNDNLLHYFRLIANDKPYITEEILRNNLSSQEAEYCIRNMPLYSKPADDTNPLDYVTFLLSLSQDSIEK